MHNSGDNSKLVNKLLTVKKVLVTGTATAVIAGGILGATACENLTSRDVKIPLEQNHTTVLYNYRLENYKYIVSIKNGETVYIPIKRCTFNDDCSTYTIKTKDGQTIVLPVNKVIDANGERSIKIDESQFGLLTQNEFENINSTTNEQ